MAIKDVTWRPPKSPESREPQLEAGREVGCGNFPEAESRLRSVAWHDERSGCETLPHSQKSFQGSAPSRFRPWRTLRTVHWSGVGDACSWRHETGMPTEPPGRARAE